VNLNVPLSKNTCTGRVSSGNDDLERVTSPGLTVIFNLHLEHNWRAADVARACKHHLVWPSLRKAGNAVRNQVNVIFPSTKFGRKKDRTASTGMAY
jgi:hypothetical protein